jgi:hypothetical protein
MQNAPLQRRGYFYAYLLSKHKHKGDKNEI